MSEKFFSLEVTKGSAGLTTELIDSLSDFPVSAQTVTSAALPQVLEHLSNKKEECLRLQPHPKIKRKKVLTDCCIFPILRVALS